MYLHTTFLFGRIPAANRLFFAGVPGFTTTFFAGTSSGVHGVCVSLLPAIFSGVVTFRRRCCPALKAF